MMRESKQIDSFSTLKGSAFLRIIRYEITTLISCAVTVAMAAPFAPIPSPATRSRSPAILKMQAIITVKSGVFESPIPLKTPPIRLYAMITIDPAPHIAM